MPLGHISNTNARRTNGKFSEHELDTTLHLLQRTRVFIPETLQGTHPRSPLRGALGPARSTRTHDMHEQVQAAVSPQRTPLVAPPSLANRLTTHIPTHTSHTLVGSCLDTSQTMPRLCPDYDSTRPPHPTRPARARTHSGCVLLWLIPNTHPLSHGVAARPA